MEPVALRWPLRWLAVALHAASACCPRVCCVCWTPATRNRPHCPLLLQYLHNTSGCIASSSGQSGGFAPHACGLWLTRPGTPPSLLSSPGKEFQKDCGGWSEGRREGLEDRWPPFFFSLPRDAVRQKSHHFLISNSVSRFCTRHSRGPDASETTRPHDHHRLLKLV